MTGNGQNSSHRIPITAFEQDNLVQRLDTLAVERPLEIQVAGARPLITMRTPGADRELVAGLMYGESVVQSCDDIVHLKHASGEADVIRLMLKPLARDRLAWIERNTLATSACGVCGKPSFSPPAPATRVEKHDVQPRIAPDVLLALPGRLRPAQALFDATGGLHAAGLFDSQGRLLVLREDVGRHNALDKLIGWAILEDRLPLSEHMLLLSGRASYELLQKSVMAGLLVVCSISAPSSYAVQLAEDFGVTLVGFLRGHRFNIYSGGERIAWPANN